MWVLSIGLRWTEAVAAAVAEAVVGAEIGAQVGVQTGVRIGTEVAMLDFLPEKVNISRIRFITELYQIQIILTILN